MTQHQLAALNQIAAWVNKPTNIIPIPLIGYDKSAVIKCKDK